MSTLWTPSGEHEPSTETAGGDPARRPRPAGDDLDDPSRPKKRPSTRRCSRPGRSWRRSRYPTSSPTTPSACGSSPILHLTPDPEPDGTPAEPRLAEAGLAIDALGALVDTLGPRLAPQRRDPARSGDPTAAGLRAGLRGTGHAHAGVSVRPERPAHDVADRAVRAHRRHPDRGAGRRRRLDRLAVRSPLRLRRVLRRAARRRQPRPLAASRPRQAAEPPAGTTATDTLVLETEFDTPEGTVRIVDCMPVRDRSIDVVRIVEGVRGRVPMTMELRRALRLRRGGAVGALGRRRHPDDRGAARSAAGHARAGDWRRPAPHRRVRGRTRATRCRSC